MLTILVLVSPFLLFGLLYKLADRLPTSTQESPSESHLRIQFQNVPKMSGVEFERYMAELYRAIGFHVTLLGGSGDQGVDLLLRDGRQSVAVQCKNHQRAVGNTPVQQVFAGQRHYRATQAWVVAPQGFTKNAFALARSTGVELFDYRSIDKWIQQAENKRSVQAKQTTFVGHSPACFDKQVGRPSSTTRKKVSIRAKRHKSPTNTAANRTYIVGDTATTANGNRLTVHSYESPVAPTPRNEPEEGYEFAAIDLEWCVSTGANGKPKKANPIHFYLHMSDNTRLRWKGNQIKEPRLPVLAPLDTGDCVRGWITFQKPKGIEPRFIIFTGEPPLVRWALDTEDVSV